MASDPSLYHGTPPGMEDHPLFSGKNSVGLLTAQNPKFPTEDINSNEDLERHLSAKGLKFEKTKGSWGMPEDSYIVHGPTQEQVYDFGHRAGQEAVVYSQNGKHSLMYTHGPNAGKQHPSLPLTRFSKEQPEDYYTTIPGKGHLTLHFDDSKMEDSPVKHTMPASQNGPSAEVSKPQLTAKSEILLAIFSGLRKALLDDAPLKPHPHAYNWHEGHTAHHQKSKGHGVLLNSDEFMNMRKLAKNEKPVTVKDIAQGLLETLKKALEATKAPDASHPTNDQAAGAGVSTFAKHTAPYGNVKKGATPDLKVYPMEGTDAKVDKLVKDHGYQTYFAGGKHGKPDLANKNYDTGHLQVWDPSAGSGGDFGHENYTRNWRVLHELAHAVTLPEVNKLYGEGRRIGGLGKQRTVREAKRATHWEHLAVHAQRRLAESIGIKIPDEQFNKEYNTVMGDAVHRAIRGTFTEPSSEGFHPHAHQVPLSVAHQMIDDHAHQIGLPDEHSLLPRRTNG